MFPNKVLNNSKSSVKMGVIYKYLTAKCRFLAVNNFHSFILKVKVFSVLTTDYAIKADFR